MRSLLSEARKVQLLTQLFNQINLWFLQGQKVVCIFTAILNGYLVIRLRQNDILVVVFCAFANIFCIIAYCGTLNRAYQLQELKKKMKRELKTACGKLPPRAEYERRRRKVSRPP